MTAIGNVTAGGESVEAGEKALRDLPRLGRRGTVQLGKGRHGASGGHSDVREVSKYGFEEII